LFAGSSRGTFVAAATYTLAAPAKLNDIDPDASLADTTRRIEDFTAAKSGDRKYRTGLGNIMISGKSSPNHCRSKSAKLTACVPPIRQVHFADPRYN
jgi:hypothetical protein